MCVAQKSKNAEFVVQNDNANQKGKYKLPMLVYTLNGDVYDKLEGYQEIHYLEDFINRNNIK